MWPVEKGLGVVSNATRAFTNTFRLLLSPFYIALDLLTSQPLVNKVNKIISEREDSDDESDNKKTNRFFLLLPSIIRENLTGVSSTGNGSSEDPKDKTKARLSFLAFLVSMAIFIPLVSTSVIGLGEINKAMAPAYEVIGQIVGFGSFGSKDMLMGSLFGLDLVGTDMAITALIMTWGISLFVMYTMKDIVSYAFDAAQNQNQGQNQTSDRGENQVGDNHDNYITEYQQHYDTDNESSNEIYVNNNNDQNQSNEQGDDDDQTRDSAGYYGNRGMYNDPNNPAANQNHNKQQSSSSTNDNDGMEFRGGRWVRKK